MRINAKEYAATQQSQRSTKSDAAQGKTFRLQQQPASKVLSMIVATPSGARSPQQMLSARQGISRPSAAPRGRDSKMLSWLGDSLSDDPDSAKRIATIDRLYDESDALMAKNGPTIETMKQQQAIEHQIGLEFLALQDGLNAPTGEMKSNMLKVINDLYMKIIRGGH